jgi:two-component system cell cycle response regulator
MLDETTGLFNRHALREFAGKYFSEAYRFSRCLSMAVIDIDHFKEINERHGFERGDQMLAELGSWMKRHVRDVDLVARWAGDELVLLLPECDLASAKNMMDRMVQRLRKIKPADLDVTVSVGIAQLRQTDNDNLNSLFELADKAMYQAKMAGRNCVRVYTDPESIPELS